MRIVWLSTLWMLGVLQPQSDMREIDQCLEMGTASLSPGHQSNYRIDNPECHTRTLHLRELLHDLQFNSMNERC